MGDGGAGRGYARTGVTVFSGACVIAVQPLSGRRSGREETVTRRRQRSYQISERGFRGLDSGPSHGHALTQSHLWRSTPYCRQGTLSARLRLADIVSRRRRHVTLPRTTFPSAFGRARPSGRYRWGACSGRRLSAYAPGRRNRAAVGEGQIREPWARLITSSWSGRQAVRQFNVLFAPAFAYSHYLLRRG